jgi:hypothetical protein
MDLEVSTLTATERWELYQRADKMHMFHGLPPQPKPLANPLVHLYRIGAQRQLWPQLQSENPDLSEDDRRACMYAWHVWRERTDVWEHPRWNAEYDPTWISEGLWLPLLYSQFLSAFELERYIVNPWIRAAAWITTLNLMDIKAPPRFDMSPGDKRSIDKSERKREKVGKGFQQFVNQVPKWWANQKDQGHFAPVTELELPTVGYISVGLRDSVRSPQPDLLVEGNWHNGFNNDLVHAEKRQLFSWDEFLWRRDELNFVLPGVIGMMQTLGPRGASVGVGAREKFGKTEGHMWAVEKKLLNRLDKRVATARRYGAVIGEIAEGQRV